MRKFDGQAVRPADSPDPAGGAPLLKLVTPPPRVASTEGLRALVGFAISRGYYQAWNKPSHDDV
jgi:hypothetical protein